MKMSEMQCFLCNVLDAMLSACLQFNITDLPNAELMSTYVKYEHVVLHRVYNFFFQM